MSESYVEVLVAERPHAAESACPRLGVGDREKLLVQKVNEVRNLVAQKKERKKNTSTNTI